MLKSTRPPQQNRCARLHILWSKDPQGLCVCCFWQWMVRRKYVEVPIKHHPKRLVYLCIYHAKLYESGRFGGYPHFRKPPYSSNITTTSPLWTSLKSNDPLKRNMFSVNLADKPPENLVPRARGSPQSLALCSRSMVTPRPVTSVAKMGTLLLRCQSRNHEWSVNSGLPHVDIIHTYM